MIKLDGVCPISYKGHPGENHLAPFFAIEFSVEEGGQSPAKVAEDLRRYHSMHGKNCYACAFVFEFDDPFPPPWEQPAARAWATTFVDEHSDALAFLIDEGELMQAGFPIGDLPLIGRVRMLALAGLAKFVPCPASKCADETVDLHVTEEGQAILRALRGQATSA